MKLLAIDTSTEVASVALQVGKEITCEQQASPKTHAQVLLPIIERLMAAAEIPFSQLDAIVFGCGPGSFTGLRIACSIAKGLAYAHDLGLIPVSSLAAIAYEVRQVADNASLPILSVIDARMQELYWAYFTPKVWVTEDQLSKAEELQPSIDSECILAGVGIDAYWDSFATTMRSRVVKKIPCYPSAAAMIALAEQENIPTIPAHLAQPVYVRNQVTQGASRG